VCLSVAATATVALAAWTLAPALRRGDWRWGAVALDTVALLCAVAVCRPALRRPGPELLAPAAAVAAYTLAVAAALDEAHSVAFVTAGLASLLAAFVALLSAALADIAGPRPWPRGLVPLVLLVAAAAALVHGLVGGWDSQAYAVGVTVLIAGAPSALAVAVLGPLWLGARRGAQAGVRIAHTCALPAAESVGVLLLDGLSTLVKGKHVASVDPVEESHLRNLRWFAGALEHASTDDVGAAIAKLSTRGNLSGVEQHPGLGISGSVDRHPVRVGEPTWIGLTPVEGPGITVAVEVDARPLGTITVVDTVRPAAPEAVQTLSQEGVEPVLLTGAPEHTARAVADETRVATLRSRADTDVDDLVGDLVGGLQREGRGLAVLSRTVATPDATLLLGPESPHLVLQECDVHAAATAILVCRSVARATRSSTYLALAWQGIAVLLAAAGLLAPWGAALAGLVGSVMLWGVVRRLAAS
jgi:hypothetical protein